MEYIFKNKTAVWIAGIGTVLVGVGLFYVFFSGGVSPGVASMEIHEYCDSSAVTPALQCDGYWIVQDGKCRWYCEEADYLMPEIPDIDEEQLARDTAILGGFNCGEPCMPFWDTMTMLGPTKSEVLVLERETCFGCWTALVQYNHDSELGNFCLQAEIAIKGWTAQYPDYLQC